MADIIVISKKELEEVVKKVMEDTLSNKILPAIKAIPEKQEFISLKEAAEFLGLAHQTIYGLTSRKEIPHIKKGKKLYFEIKSLINWMKEGKQKYDQ